VLDNPAPQDCQENNGFGDMMDEDVMNNVSVRLKLSLTVWDFTLPVTPSLPAVFGVSWQYSFYYVPFPFLCCATVMGLGSMGCASWACLAQQNLQQQKAVLGCCCPSQTSSRDMSCAIGPAVLLPL